MEKRIVYITASSTEEARAIGKALVGERLAACANILGGISSIFWWDGSVQEEGEVAMIAKTTDACAERLIARVRELHSYDCPCVVMLPIVAGNPAFLDWIAGETEA